MILTLQIVTEYAPQSGKEHRVQSMQRAEYQNTVLKFARIFFTKLSKKLFAGQLIKGIEIILSNRSLLRLPEVFMTKVKNVCCTFICFE